MRNEIYMKGKHNYNVQGEDEGQGEEEDRYERLHGGCWRVNERSRPHLCHPFIQPATAPSPVTFDLWHGGGPHSGNLQLHSHIMSPPVV